MPFDLEAEIARRLQVAPETVGPVLSAVIERIRQQVSHFGYARVAGLGTFRGHNGHLAFEPEPVLADEVNSRFAGLEVLDVAPARHAHDDDEVEPLDVPAEDDETLYGPSPGDDYERGDAGMDDEEQDDRESSEGEDADRAEDVADPHATITPVYDPAKIPGAEYEVESHARAGADEIGESQETDDTDVTAGEPTYWKEQIGVPPADFDEETERGEDTPAAFPWEGLPADVERESDEPVEEDLERFGPEQPEHAESGDTEPYWTGEEEERGDESRASTGWDKQDEQASEVAEEGWLPDDEQRGAEDEEWLPEEQSHAAEGLAAAEWVDEAAEAEAYEPAPYQPETHESATDEPDVYEPAASTSEISEGSELEPSESDGPDESAEYDPVTGESAREWPANPEAPEDVQERRPAVEWNPSEERSEADLYAEEEAAMAAGAMGGAAAAAGDREEFIEQDDAFSDFSDDSGDAGDADEATGVFEAVERADEAEPAVDDSTEHERSREASPDREALPPQGAREPADRRPAAASAAATDAVAGRRSAVLIAIGVVVLLAAAAVIYLATSDSPVEESAGPAIAETPVAQDTAAAAASEAPGAAASEAPGAAASDTADLAVTTPPSTDPTPSQTPASQTSLDPLRGTEPIDRAAGGYTLVVFSDFSDSNANTVAATYREQGFRTGVLDDRDSGRTRFRVAVGQFSTLDEAVEARDRLAGSGLPDDAWVRRIQ